MSDLFVFDGRMDNDYTVGRSLGPPLVIPPDDYYTFTSKLGADYRVAQSQNPPAPLPSQDYYTFSSYIGNDFLVARSSLPIEPLQIIDVLNSYYEFNETQYAQADLGRVRKGTFGNGSNLYGTIPVWEATDWEIEFDAVFPTSPIAGVEKILDSETVVSAERPWLEINSGKFRWYQSTISSLLLDGVAATYDVTDQPTDGAIHRMKLSGSSAIDLDKLLARLGGAQYGTASIFNLRLTDLDNPSNSRFYPMDEDGSTNEGHDIFYSTKSLGSDLTADWRQTYTEVDVTTSWDGEKLTVVAEDGASDRIEIPVTGLEIGKTYLYEVDLNKAGGELHATIDGATWGEEQWNGVNWTDRRVWRKLVTATATSGVCRIYTAQSTANGGQAGDTLEIYGVSIRETDAGIWHNRTPADIKDIYLDPIGPSEDFFMAVKFTVFEPPQDDYPMVLSVGGNNGGVLVKIHLTKATGRLAVEFWERDGLGNATNIGGGSIPDYTSIDWVTPKTCLLVSKKDGTTGEHTMWVDGGLTDVRARPTMQYPYGGRIHLNGEWDENGGVRRSCEGIRIHYACIYEDLTQEDIDAILTDTVDPSTVGVWKQGYLAEGGGKEAFGGNPLTFYNGYRQYLPITSAATAFFFEMGWM